MKKIIWGIAIASLFCIGCGSDDNKDVKANQQPSAQNNQNENLSAPSESDDAGTNPSTPSNPGALDNPDVDNPPSENETKTCDPACPDGQACIDGACKAISKDCPNACDANHVCIDGARTYPGHTGSCR